MTYPLRVFFIGGLMSFRALFNFLRPSIYIPSMLVAPIFQILLFVYIGRSAGLESDEFYVIGNAIQYAAVPCLFAMIFTIAGERYQRTLGYLLVTPAPRLPLFVGRALPVVVNGWVVAVFSLVVGGAIVGIDIAARRAWPLLALAALVSAFGCTGFGLLGAGLGLLVRDQAVLANILFGLLLVFTGANVPIDVAPRLDAGRLRGAAVHARDRGRAADRRRRGARRRERPARRPRRRSARSTRCSATSSSAPPRRASRRYATLETCMTTAPDLLGGLDAST